MYTLIARGNDKEDPRARSSAAVTDGAGTDDLMITNEIKPHVAAGPSTGPDAIGDKGAPETSRHRSSQKRRERFLLSWISSFG